MRELSAEWHTFMREVWVEWHNFMRELWARTTLNLKRLLLFGELVKMDFPRVWHPFGGQTRVFVQNTSRALPLGVVITHIQMNSMIEIIAMISSTQLSAERSVLFIIGSFLNFK